MLSCLIFIKFLFNFSVRSTDINTGLNLYLDVANYDTAS